MNSQIEKQDPFVSNHYTPVQAPADVARARAIHMTKSWLLHFGASAEVQKNKIVATFQDRSAIAHLSFGVTDDRHTASINRKGDILSPDLGAQLKAIHVLTKALGLGEPKLVGREAARKRNLSYHDHYENVYLRTTALSRVPNPPLEAFERFEGVIVKAARKAFYQYRTVWTAIGNTNTDLESFGRLHLCVFYHNWAYGTHEEVEKRLYSYLKQRFGEWAKIARKKAANATCLVEHRHFSPAMGDDDNAFDPMLFVPADVEPADQDWDVGEYLLTTPDGDGKLIVERSSSTELRFWLRTENGFRLLAPRDLERMEDGINMGRVKLVKVEEMQQVEEDQDVQAKKVRRIAQRELVRIPLIALALDESADPEKRADAVRKLQKSEVNVEEFKGRIATLKDALCIAALDAKLDTRTRNAARKICDLVGISPEAFRAQLEAEGHNLVETFVNKEEQEKKDVVPAIPVFDDEQARAALAMPAKVYAKFLANYRKKVPGGDDNLDFGRWVCQQGFIKNASAKMIAACSAGIKGEGLTCPSPHHSNEFKRRDGSLRINGTLKLKDFGVRVTRAKNGMPVRANRQSNCTECRKRRDKR